MKYSRLLLAAMLILSWLTLPLLGWNTFKKFFPAAIFISVFTKLLDIFGERKKWWLFYKGIPPLDSMDFLNFGPYFVSSFWMLKMTYGKLPVYLLFNTLLHILFIFVGLKYLGRFRILSLVRLTKIQYLGIHFLRALLLYAFQFFKERTAKPPAVEDIHSVDSINTSDLKML
ncbi:hypothetical protein SAMN05877753_104371 [Bacillus oleivorans]|uniref:Uncharacterized protein n=1 Tax=Bacillus oleivorans TaxID=1448271 RepID=A0A285CTG9_9BACI|nr:hypothetical protein [Bacillus oleivorans]SNX70804.1 hypothetical protein SAMN05877753_104371 [Bacillus oleivorans]